MAARKKPQDGLQSAFNTMTAGLKESDAMYQRAEKALEAQRLAVGKIGEELKANNDLSVEQKKNVRKLTKEYKQFQSLTAQYTKDVKDGLMTQEQANKKINQMRVGFDRLLKTTKLTGKENETMLAIFKKMSSEMGHVQEAFEKTNKKAQLFNAAVDHLGASGIPLLDKFGDVLKNVVAKNAEGARIAMTALGAAAAILYDKYNNADAYAGLKADLDRQKNNIGAEIELAKLDNKRGFVKQRRDVAVAELNVNTANEVAKIDNKAGFIKQNIAMSVAQNSIDTANTVNQLTIEAAHASQRAAVQFSAQMQTGAAEFQAAAKTALFGKSLGSIGYGAAQMQLAGVGAENVASSLSAASKAMGNKVSSEMAADMALLEKRTGASSDNISSMVSFFKRANKVSAGTALNMVEGMRAMADSANIDLGGLMEEVASASKEALGYQIKSGPALQKQVAYAQQLGVSFNDVAKAGKSMVLNYKDSIKNEMELSAMLGRNVNLSEARALFAQGKTDDALKSIKAQGLDPSKMNMFQQESLSKALGGMDLDSLQKIATGSAKDVSAQTGNVKAGNKGFLSATQSAQSTLAAQQASISAKTAIIDAQLSGQITKAYLESDGYKKYQENLLQQQKKQAELDANTEKAFLNSNAYLKYQNDLIGIEQRNIKLGNDETNAYIMSKKGIELAAKDAKFDIERMYEENKRTALVGAGGAIAGNLLGKAMEMGMNKLFGKSNPMPVTIVDGGGGPLDELKDAVGDKLTNKVKDFVTKKVGKNKILSKVVDKFGTKGAEKLAAKATEKVVAKTSEKVMTKVVTKTAGKALGKSLLKKIPFLGLGAALFFAGERAMAGDYAGAGLEMASGGASMLPGAGTAASAGIDAIIAARDLKQAGVIGGGSTASASAGKVIPKVAPSTKPSLVLNDVQYQTRLQTEMVALLGMSSGFLKQLLEVSAAEFDRPININGTKLNANLLSAARKNYAVARKEAVGAYKAP